MFCGSVLPDSPAEAPASLEAAAATSWRQRRGLRVMAAGACGTVATCALGAAVLAVPASAPSPQASPLPPAAFPAGPDLLAGVSAGARTALVAVRETEAAAAHERRQREQHARANRRPVRPGRAPVAVSDPAGDGARGDRDMVRAAIRRTRDHVVVTYDLLAAPAGPAAYMVTLTDPSSGRLLTRLEAIRRVSGRVDMDTYSPLSRPAFRNDPGQEHAQRESRVTFSWPLRIVAASGKVTWKASVQIDRRVDEARPSTIDLGGS